MSRLSRVFGISVITGVMAFSGCASGKYRSDARVSRDRIPAKQSSYRVRGTDVTGVLSTTQKQKLRSKTYSWRWPTNEVKVTSSFGERGSHHHDGIDLRAPIGTQVRAVGDGKVIYSGSKISGYGRMIVIRHAGKLSSIYAHNSKLQVKAGQKVRRGQLIAFSGNTGRSSGPHVHFEIREGVTAINPLVLLPSPQIANEANRRMIGQNSGKEGARSRDSRRAPARSNRKEEPESQSYSQSSTKRLTAKATMTVSRKGQRMAATVAEDDGFRPKSPHRNIR